MKESMKTFVSTGEVSLLPVSGTGWEVKIGAAQAGFTEKLRFGIANWLDNLRWGENHGKGPRRSWAKVQMGNPDLIVC